MNTAVFRIAVFATVVTTSTSLTITPTTDMVTVRLGEAIHLSCVITLTPTESVTEVRWYRNSSFVPYGSIVFTSGCIVASSCPDETTTDNRGTVRYKIRTSNDPVLTLTINSSTLQDNDSFSCGIIKLGGSSQTSSGISVTVYVPEATSPIPGHQTPLGTTTTESTTNSADTTTVDGSISSHQTSTTSTRDTSTTTRLATDETVPTTTPITATTSEQIPSMVPTSFEPDTGPSSIMTTVVSTVKTVLTSASDANAPAPAANSTTAIAVVVSACIIVILLVIIACLVSRKSRKPRGTEQALFNLTATETDNQEVNRRAQDTDAEHVYEGTLRRTRRPQDVESSTSQQSPPVYATPNIRRKPQTACSNAPQDAAPTRPPWQRDQYEDPEMNAVVPGPDKAGYLSLDPPRGHPPEYARIDPHSRPSSAVESGNVYTAEHMARRHDQTEETARDKSTGDAVNPCAEIPQPPVYAQLEPDSEPQTPGIPEHSSPEYSTPNPSTGAAGDGTGTVNQDAVIPELFSPEYATLDPDAGVIIDDESGTGHQEAENPEQLSPEYAVLHPDTAATNDEDDEELPMDGVYAQPF